MKMVQVRNVPDDLHSTLKARAALAGMSLSDFLLAEMRRLASRPSPEEMRRRLAARPTVSPPESPAEVIRAIRADRAAELDDR